MFDSTTPDHIALRLPADTYYHLIRTLRLTLPPPLTDSAEDLLRRDHAAIARIAALVPANAAEADLAAQFVAASEQWKDCLRLAQSPGTTPEWAAKCRAQAIGMMRQANSALRLLLRLQATREKREADNAARDRAAWTEHCALALMAEALAPNPHPNPLPEGEGEGAAPPLPRAGEGRGEGETARAAVPQAQVLEPQPEPEPSEAAPNPDLIAAAERYAATYPERAASIRRMGRLPDDVRYFEPPEAALAGALIAAHTPALAALDRDFADPGGGRGCPVRACPGESRGHGARAA